MGSNCSCNSSAAGELVAVRSKIPKEMRQFRWTIADFAELEKYSKEMMEGIKLEFQMGSGIGLPVKLKLGVKWRVDKDEEEYLHLYVSCQNAPPGVTQVMVSMEGEISNLSNMEFAQAVNVIDRNWLYGLDIVEKDEELSSPPLDVHGGLPIDIKVTLYNANGLDLPMSVHNLIAKFEERFLQTLQSDVDKLREDPIASVGAPEIVQLVSQDGNKFPVNWLILAARSPVFRTMFQTPMSEVGQGLVKLEDIRGAALEVFLTFLHTGTLADKWKDAGIVEEITQAAHKYEIQDLLDFLDEALALVCGSNDCGKMYRLARTLELKKAEKALLYKIQEQWKEVQGVKKMMQLFDNLAFGD